MRLTRVIAHRLLSVFRRSRVDAKMTREIEIHIEQLTREYVAHGMGLDAARQRARRDFGSIDSVKDRCRDVRRVTVVEDLRRGVGFAGRLLVRSPAFTLTTVLSLTVGIVANIAIFSLVDAVLLRSLPVSEPKQLVEVIRVGAGGALSYPMYERIRAAGGGFLGLVRRRIRSIGGQCLR